MATISFTQSIIINVVTCANCGIKFGLEESYQNRKRYNHEDFYCPNGHSQYYPQDNEAERLQKELKRKEQELANTVITKIQLQNDLNKKNRDLNRLKKGVCHCCNRSFVNLQRHMKTKHPEIVK